MVLLIAILVSVILRGLFWRVSFLVTRVRGHMIFRLIIGVWGSLRRNVKGENPNARTYNSGVRHAPAAVATCRNWQCVACREAILAGIENGIKARVPARLKKQKKNAPRNPKNASDLPNGVRKSASVLDSVRKVVLLILLGMSCTVDASVFRIRASITPLNLEGMRKMMNW